MKLTAAREDVLAPLQSVIGVVERRQTMPVLANVLLGARDNRLSVTGSDLEVELVATSNVSVQQSGDILGPGQSAFYHSPVPRKVAVELDSTRACGASRQAARGTSGDGPNRKREPCSSTPPSSSPILS